jgi:hypothetical protein
VPRINIKFALLWVGILALAAFARVHFRSVTTGIAYDLGQLKNNEGRLLEERSALRGELARLTTKKNLEKLSDRPEPTSSPDAREVGSQ